jgi:CheY-like chemotaxis protein
VASTLLAVDDSVTMRKVLEITFAGTDLQVVTADSPDAALSKVKSDKPDLVIADVTLAPKDGYELCKAVKQASPATQVLILSSKQHPYDAAKGEGAKADDHMDKPFDTQQMIDKVRKMLQSKGDVAAAPAPVAAAVAPFAATLAGPPGPHTSPTQPAQPAVNPMGRTAPQASPMGGAPPQRAKTLIYSPAAGTPAIPAPTAKPVSTPKPDGSTPVTGVPMTSRTAPAAHAPAPAAPAPSPATTAAAAHVNGQMASKLEGLGLTPAQVDAVLALSRDVVERVVWEVVPVLAETIIKEEIARITK